MKSVKFEDIKGRTNHVELRGNLTADPVVKTLGNSTLVELRLASSRPVEIRGEKSEEVLFVDIEYRGKDAEAAAQFLKKGTPIFIEGALKQDRWEKGDQKFSKVKVVGFELSEVLFPPKQGEAPRIPTGFPKTVTFEALKEAKKNSNSLTLKGNLCADAETRVAPTGTAITSFRLAVNRKFKTAAGEAREEVSYFNVTQMGEKAREIAGLQKGAPVFIEGKLNLDEWQTKGPEPKNRSEVNIRAFEVANVAPSQRQARGENAGAEEGVEEGGNVPY